MRNGRLPKQILITSFLLILCPVFFIGPLVYFSVVLNLGFGYSMEEMVVIIIFTLLPLVLAWFVRKGKKWPRTLVLIAAGIMVLFAVMRFEYWTALDFFALIYLGLFIASAIMLYGKPANDWYNGRSGGDDTDGMIDQV